MKQPERVVEVMLTRRELRMVTAALHLAEETMMNDAVRRVSSVLHSIKRDYNELADKIDRIFEYSEEAVHEDERIRTERMRNVTSFGSMPSEPEPQFIACNPPQENDGTDNS